MTGYNIINSISICLVVLLLAGCGALDANEEKELGNSQTINKIAELYCLNQNYTGAAAVYPEKHGYSATCTDSDVWASRAKMNLYCTSDGCCEEQRIPEVYGCCSPWQVKRRHCNKARCCGKDPRKTLGVR